MTNWLTAVGRVLRTDLPPSRWAWMDRQVLYNLWDSYYSNTVYEASGNGGQREQINADLGNAAAADLAGLYNPCAATVDLYLHVFGGEFGEEITVEPEAPASQALTDAIEQVWQWSNMTIEKQPLCRHAANQGTVGLRVVAVNDPDPARRRIYIKPEHPRVIRDVELDDRGNVIAIQVEYEKLIGLAEQQQVVIIREEMTKEYFATARVEGMSAIPYDTLSMADFGPMARYPNPLGVVPYVLLRHEYTGDTWGRNAYYKQRGPIDRLNALLSHIDVQIHRHVRAKWFIAAAGAAPTEIDLSDLSVAYVDTRNQTSTPIVEPLVAPLDLMGAIAQAKLQLDLIEDQLPELKAVGGKFLAGQSGETIAQLRKPAEDRLALARDNYEDAMVRAQKIAVSWGVLLGLWDVGTGMGSYGAAEAAYRGGYEDHHFTPRPLLPTDTAQPQPEAPQTAQAAPGEAAGPQVGQTPPPPPPRAAPAALPAPQQPQPVATGQEAR